MDVMDADDKLNVHKSCNPVARGWIWHRFKYGADTLGIWVGDADDGVVVGELELGDAVGLWLGDAVGYIVGTRVGRFEGVVVLGDTVGVVLGLTEGVLVEGDVVGYANVGDSEVIKATPSHWTSQHNVKQSV
jgi:hypothetical protein